jgi:ubiquinone/menaquinone biosynthesis C-methylase UbiE
MGRADPRGGFEGVGGRLAASVMARVNRDMERAAIDELDPDPDHRVLSIGFGAGVGLAQLAPRLPTGWAAGIDPSATMTRVAAHRNRSSIRRGRVELRRAGAGAIPWPDQSFDGVLAVNCVQLWPSLEAGVDEVARVLRADGAFVTVTHVWALEKRDPVERWLATLAQLLPTRGLGRLQWRTEAFRSGAGLVVTARAGQIEGH